VLWLSGLGVCGCASFVAPGDAAVSAIVNGAADATDPAVVLLRATTSGSQTAAICSGTVVAPSMILTAAHCVHPAVVGAGASFDVFLGSNLATQGSDTSLWTHVASTVYDTAFDPSQLTSGHDVGVAFLAAPVSIAPVALNQVALTNADVGSSLRIVGFGTSNGSDTTGVTAGIRRTGNAPLSSFDSLTVHLGAGAQSTCDGDSGGPAFLDGPSGEVQIGITSYGLTDCSQGGTDTRVDTVAVTFLAPLLPSVSEADGGLDAGGPSMGSVIGGGGGGSPRSGCSFAPTAVSGGGAIGSLLILLAIGGLARRRRS
jgi:secreted trypsin-like serine protease